jgi:membrane-bound lytic murein transglycosylase MltF
MSVLHRVRGILLALPLLVASSGVTFAGQAAAPAPPASKAPAKPKSAAVKETKSSGVSTDLVSRPWTGDFDGMVKRRLIRILTPYSKTAYFIDKGVPRGTAYEASVKLEEELNKKLKTTLATKIHVAVVPTTRDELADSLLKGRGDIIAAGITVTPERAQIVDFTVPTKTNISEIVVTGPGAPTLTNLDSLSGQEVAVRDKSIQFESLQKLNATFAQQGKAPVKIRTVPTSLEDEDLLEMTNAGLLKTVVVDDYLATFWKQIFASITLHPDLAVRQDGDLAWAARKNSPKLIAALNPIVKANAEGTLFGNVLLKKYLTSTKFVKSATEPGELAKFNRLIEIFRKYGDKYSVDFLLMMAQGFQESRLDQTVKSQVGAVGVMQVMPATGKDMKVGDIHQIDPNIEAGVKYMRFMIDQYYKDEPMDDLNKVLFSFASYNAGPARIRQLRKLTASRGLNPNVWFNNVERVVSEKIGRETVTYVSNIYKYYVAYTLSVEQAREREKAKAETGGR